MLSAQLFDKGTERLVKIQDHSGNKFVFKLGRDKGIPDFKAAMNHGELVAYAWSSPDGKHSNRFRVPITDELVDGWFGGVSTQMVVGPDVKFWERIKHIIEVPESDHAVLKAAMKGVEKLATLQLSTANEPAKPVPVVAPVVITIPAKPVAEPTVIMFRGKALEKVEHRWVMRSTVPCVNCSEPIQLYATAKISDGIAESLVARKPVNKDAHKVNGEYYLWVHNECPEAAGASEPITLGELQPEQPPLTPEQASAPDSDVTAFMHRIASIFDTFVPNAAAIDQILTLLASDKTAEYKLGYLTSHFEQEKRKTSEEYRRGFLSGFDLESVTK